MRALKQKAIARANVAFDPPSKHDIIKVIPTHKGYEGPLRNPKTNEEAISHAKRVSRY